MDWGNATFEDVISEEEQGENVQKKKEYPSCLKVTDHFLTPTQVILIDATEDKRVLLWVKYIEGARKWIEYVSFPIKLEKNKTERPIKRARLRGLKSNSNKQLNLPLKELRNLYTQRRPNILSFFQKHFNTRRREHSGIPGTRGRVVILLFGDVHNSLSSVVLQELPIDILNLTIWKSDMKPAIVRVAMRGTAQQRNRLLKQLSKQYFSKEVIFNKTPMTPEKERRQKRTRILKRASSDPNMIEHILRAQGSYKGSSNDSTKSPTMSSPLKQSSKKEQLKKDNQKEKFVTYNATDCCIVVKDDRPVKKLIVDITKLHIAECNFIVEQWKSAGMKKDELLMFPSSVKWRKVLWSEMADTETFPRLWLSGEVREEYTINKKKDRALHDRFAYDEDEEEKEKIENEEKSDDCILLFRVLNGTDESEITTSLQREANWKHLHLMKERFNKSLVEEDDYRITKEDEWTRRELVKYLQRHKMYKESLQQIQIVKVAVSGDLQVFSGQSPSKISSTKLEANVLPPIYHKLEGVALLQTGQEELAKTYFKMYLDALLEEEIRRNKGGEGFGSYLLGEIATTALLTSDDTNTAFIRSYALRAIEQDQFCSVAYESLVHLTKMYGETTPQQEEALFNYFVHIASDGENYDQLEDFYSTVTESSSSNIYTHYYYALYLSEIKGDIKKAHTHFKRVMDVLSCEESLSIEQAQMIGTFATFEHQHHPFRDRMATEHHYRQAWGVDQHNPVWPTNLAGYLFEEGRKKEAFEVLATALDDLYNISSSKNKNKNKNKNYNIGVSIKNKDKDKDGDEESTYNDMHKFERKKGRKEKLLHKALLQVECWFYLLCHRTGEDIDLSNTYIDFSNEEVMVLLKEAIETGGRSPSWNFEPHLASAEASGHPEYPWLLLLSKVISNESKVSDLEEWTKWPK